MHGGVQDDVGYGGRSFCTQCRGITGTKHSVEYKQLHDAETAV